MTQLELLKALLYLDRDFISSYYECVSGQAATTHFTHQEGKKAGAGIPIFSAELSAVEIKSYNVSSLRMLEVVYEPLSEYLMLDLNMLAKSKTTQYGWISGKLSVAMSKTTSKSCSGEEKVLAKSIISLCSQATKPYLGLITADSNFQSGINALTRLQSTILKDFSIHVRAFLRALPSATHIGHMIAVPLVILEESAPKAES